MFHRDGYESDSEDGEGWEEGEWVTDSSAEEEGEEDVEKEEEGEEDVEKEEEGEVEEGEGKGEGSVTTKDSLQLQPDVGRLGVVNKKTYNIMYIAESECHGGILRAL